MELNHLSQKWLLSAALVALLLVARWLAVRLIGRQPASEDDLKRHWINTVKNTSNLLIAIGLVIVWLSELRLVALSVATFIVAIVIALREFIQCFVGSLYLTSSRNFAVGDWIKLGAMSGEVIRSDWLTTALLEVDIDDKSYNYTGKTLIIPNNQFISQPIQNLNFMRRYVIHSFDIVREANEVNVFKAKAFILEKANACCQDFKEVAARYNNKIEKQLGKIQSGPEPSVRVSTTDLGRNRFTVTVFCPNHKAIDIEQEIMEDFMNFWYESRLEGTSQEE